MVTMLDCITRMTMTKSVLGHGVSKDGMILKLVLTLKLILDLERTLNILQLKVNSSSFLPMNHPIYCVVGYKITCNNMGHKLLMDPNDI